jgi:hypothetical protein
MPLSQMPGEIKAAMNINNMLIALVQKISCIIVARRRYRPPLSGKHAGRSLLKTWSHAVAGQGQQQPPGEHPAICI